MKQISILSLLLCLLAGAGYAATISGTVFSAQTNNPVANQIVYVSDSLTGFSASDTTDANGLYSINLPATMPAGDDLYARTYACGQSYSNYHTYTGSSVTSNFSICAAAPVYRLHGNVTLSGAANTGIADVYLIYATYDSLSLSWSLTAIDTIATNASGAYSKTYSVMPTGQLLLKAALRTGHPSYTAYPPTYYTSALNWSSGTYLTSANFDNATNTNISLIGGVNPGGPGFIGGLVSQGANRGTAVGDPLAGRILLLTTMGGQAVAYTQSDANGRFSFPNLAYGTYKIFGDAWGKENPELTVTISAAQSSVNNIEFKENSTRFKGIIGSLGINNAAALSGVTVSPVPAADFVQLNGLSKVDGDKLVVLSDINGAVISSHTFAQSQPVRIATSALPSGMYILHVQSASGNAQFKLVK